MIKLKKIAIEIRILLWISITVILLLQLSDMSDRPYDMTLPFAERFRPKVLNDVLSHDAVISTLKIYLDTRRIPHLLFYGPPGTGKTSTIESFLRELYTDEFFQYMVLNINASEERGIDVVRNKIKNFVSTKPIRTDANLPVFKFVILDEADAITAEAQAMLRIVIESNTEYARFCLICNCVKKINPAIQSRCKIFKFSPLDTANINKKIDSICKINNLEVTDDGKRVIWELSKGDMRKVLHLLQVISMTNQKIDADTVCEFMKYPSKDVMDQIYESTKTQDLSSMIDLLKTYKLEKSYSIKDIMAELSDRVYNDINNKTLSLSQAIYICQKFRDIEMNMLVTSETEQQLSSICAAFVVMRSIE